MTRTWNFFGAFAAVAGLALVPSGTYGATGSGAMHIDDEHFAGTGSLVAGEFGTLLLVR